MTAGPTPDVRYLRAPHVLWRSTLDAVVLLPDGAEEPFALSGTGPEIWHLLRRAAYGSRRRGRTGRRARRNPR